MRHGIAVVLVFMLVSSAAWADTIVTFNFEGEAAGPLAQGTTFTDATTGLRISISRLTTFPVLQEAPFSLFDLTPFGVPFGMSLSPFDNPALAIPFVISIDTSGLLGLFAGQIVNQISWTMGDFVPSDLDRITVFTMAGGIPFSATIGIPFNMSLGFFGTATGSAQRTEPGGITELRLLGGSEPRFPNSLYYGGFSFTLSSVAAGSDLPESSAGGDPPTDDTDGAGAPPVPEPAGLAVLGLAVALLARRRRG